MPTAVKAVLADAYIKTLIWGEPGSGKSRFALSSPSPLVIDLEGSTRLYAGEFDFLVAGVNRTIPDIESPAKLVTKIVTEIESGEYPDCSTLVIDPITDLLDNLEMYSAASYEKMIGRKVSDLNALQKTKWYAYRRDRARNMIDRIKDLPMNLILVARSKPLWTDDGGKMKVDGETYDALPIVESLMDIVIHLQKQGKNNYTAKIKKSRLGNLPDTLETSSYSGIISAIRECQEEATKRINEEK